MKLLLDTHAFIWLDGQSVSLSPRVRTLIQEKQNTVFLSVASIWEIQIKHQLGKLQLRMPLADIVEAQRQSNGIEIVEIAAPHVFELNQLPNHHKVPFDRMLIAQARVENAILVSSDPIIAKYPVQIIW